ncbi:hypothetical protein H2201_004119 [Coniosporium apollinis]|uniref:Glycosyltransferase family 69 protein n=1 Tax=Coniosporium apollinis TaxID=61459 RepID=A0ABQ9NXP3_9PEZI|nr:hypothetical protein H2201_004119 [Coniosporium apollinis]
MLKLGLGRMAPIQKRRERRRIYHLLFSLACAIPYLLVILVITVAALHSSYTHKPAHYKDLADQCLGLEPGCANKHNEKVFIAASIYDEEGQLAGGAWGKAVKDLVNILGPENVFVSVYENDPDSEAKDALERFGKNLKCNSSIVSEHISYDELPHITYPSGEKRLKRVAFLAEVRNRALRPLDQSASVNATSPCVRFDKILYLNDVIFKPIEAAQLLFSTNMQADGRTNYRAACATDFINPFKFYDNFATRDLDGYSMGIPFYPWFTDAGNGHSRQDVLDQKDAVRVRSCWGGMVAFEAKWFQAPALDDDKSTPDREKSPPGTLPIRFRAENDTFWDASECCLIHADLQYPRSPTTDRGAESGIFMNPFIRVAYDASTLSWLPWTRRPERLYSVIHNILNHAMGLPWHNPRRTEEPGTEATERVWRYEPESWRQFENGEIDHPEGSFEEVNRVVGPGRFCGIRMAAVINEHPKKGEHRWEVLPVPPA